MTTDKIYKLYEKALSSNDIKVVKSALRKFGGFWFSEKESTDYYRGLFNGTEPSAVKILEDALKRIKKKEGEK